MRIALIADIHGNLAALDATLAALEELRPDQIVCLGDIAATGPWPRQVLHRLRDLGCPVVMGNADAELLVISQDDPDDEFMTKIQDISRWAAAQLDDDDRAFIASFQPTVEITLETGRSLLCMHGSPRGYDDIITAATPDAELDGLLAGHEADVYAGGHTHVRMLRAWRGREIINPGSVGLAYQFPPAGAVRIPPWAEFAILSWSEECAATVEFRRVPYDRDATVRAMTEHDMPHAAWWAADWT